MSVPIFCLRNTKFSYQCTNHKKRSSGLLLLKVWCLFSYPTTPTTTGTWFISISRNHKKIKIKKLYCTLILLVQLSLLISFSSSPHLLVRFTSLSLSLSLSLPAVLFYSSLSFFSLQFTTNNFVCRKSWNFQHLDPQSSALYLMSSSFSFFFFCPLFSSLFRLDLHAWCPCRHRLLNATVRTQA